MDPEGTDIHLNSRRQRPKSGFSRIEHENRSNKAHYTGPPPGLRAAAYMSEFAPKSHFPHVGPRMGISLQ